MLTTRQNLLETIRGGNPDRLVNQYEYLSMTTDPLFLNCAGVCGINEVRKTDWGFYVTWPEDVPGAFPLHDDEHLLIKDVTEWRDVLVAPDPWAYTAEQWAGCDEFMNSIDRNETFAAAMVATGIFEKVHYMMGIDNACMNFILEPEAMHELIDFIADWEIEVAKVQIEHFHPDALFHHDDWGTQFSTFMSPEMFEEFIVPAYKKVYGYYKDHGVELIVHHSDSYAETLVPYMIEMGIDIWQGAMSTNNLPELIKNYGGQISFHGGLNNGIYDVENWSPDAIRTGLEELIESTGVHYIIPGLTAGGPVSVYEGVYEATSEEIAKLSKKLFV